MNRYFVFTYAFLRRLIQAWKTPSYTIEYPYVARKIPNQSRTRLKNDFKECTGCMKCADECPTACVILTGQPFFDYQEVPKNSKGHLFQQNLQGFAIDYSRCIQCGICVQVCPENSLTFDRGFLHPEQKLQHLRTDLVRAPRTLIKQER